MIERNHDIDLPTDVRRILQQLDDIEKQRKKPLFIERKIGKSLSVNSHLGFPLKVLEELNERENEGSPVKKKTPFFENTYEHLRQQRAFQQRPNRLIDPPSIISSSQQLQQQSTTEYSIKTHIDIDGLKSPNNQNKNINKIKSPTEIDSGIGTPLSPPADNRINKLPITITTTNATEEINSTTPINNIDEQQQQKSLVEMHPLSMCGDVNFRFNGTTQLKTLKPTHPRLSTPRHSTTDIIEPTTINTEKS